MHRSSPVDKVPKPSSLAATCGRELDKAARPDDVGRVACRQLDEDQTQELRAGDLLGHTRKLDLVVEQALSILLEGRRIEQSCYLKLIVQVQQRLPECYGPLEILHVNS